jgi:Zn-dependent M16 (insulinase) family peptidase
LQALVENTRALKRRQETPDSPAARATIPMLRLTDLDKENKRIPCAIEEQGGCPLLYHDLPTNGIVYLDLGLNLHTLPQTLLPYVPVFGRALLEMGAGQDDFVRLSQRIGRDTGGIRPEVLTSAVRGTRTGVAWLFLRGKALAAQAEPLLAILRDIVHTPLLDNQERFRQIVLEEKAEAEAKLAPYGDWVVDLRLRAHFNEADWAAEQMKGISYLFFLRKLAAAVEEDWAAVLATLEQLRRTLVQRGAMLCNVTLDALHWARLQPELAAFLAGLPPSVVETAAWTPQAGPRAEGLVIPAQVNYVGQAADLYQLGYHPHGSVAVMTKFLGTTWLWDRVRVRGGAYGGFCNFDRMSGVWSFLSYRDPNLLPTLAVYKDTSRFLRELALDQAGLNGAIIGAIGEMDAHQLPDAKGWTSLYRYLVGDTDADRQRRREEILATTAADFQAFGEVLARIDDNAPIAILGGEPALTEANAERPGWLTLVPVL